LLAQVLLTTFFLITYMLTMIQMLPAMKLSKNLFGVLMLSGLTLMGNVSLGQQTAIYTVTSTSAATQTGTKPTGSGHTYSQTFGTAKQITNGNSATLTLTGYTGYRISSIVLEMRSNTSAGAGTLSVVAGSTSIASVSPTQAFNTASWNGAYSTTYVNVTKTPTAYNITTGQDVVITIAATTSSLYIQKYTITYVPAGFTVTFDANGGTGTMADQTASSATALTANAFTRAGYTFAGWATSAGGAVAYANSASYPFTANATLYAQWTASSTPAVNLSVNASTGTEAGTTVITATATASSAVTGAQTVDIAVTGSGITAGDYTLSGTSISIANGATTGSVTFTIANDAAYECTETATLTISNPSAGITLGGTTSQNVTITDNDLPTVNLSINTTSGSEAATTSITLTATASSAVIGAQTVSVALTGTGLANADFSGATFPATITIANGATTGTATFTIVDDSSIEGDESATFTISSPSSCLALGATTTQGLAITDNDFPAVNLSINNATGTEAATTSITLTATASAAVVGDQTVNVALTGAGLTAADFTGIDFSTAQTITILNGANTGTRTFAVANDAVYECLETATFTISAPTSGIVLGATTTRTHAITDNDFPTVNLSINTASGSEAATTSITLTATASAAVIGAQTVSVALSGTGLANADFSGASFPATITIANGATTGTVTFTIVDDSSIEGDESATFTISSPSSCVALGATTTQGLTIVENDFPAAPCSELFISEYHEAASGNEKYIEIYNPTSSAVTLTGTYALVQYNNGSGTVSATLALSGSVPGFGTVYAAHSSSTLVSGAIASDASVMTFNGNDVIALRKSGVNIDVIGTIGSSANFAVDIALRRLATVNGPVTTYNAAEWSSVAANNVTNIGSYTNNCTVTNPVVTLGINTATGSEAATTSITLTATADAAVTGNQTVQVTLSGTGVANTDFSSVTFPTNITILGGQQLRVASPSPSIMMWLWRAMRRLHSPSVVHLRGLQLEHLARVT
jgi:uncharacterized repeat protein (TIGR02543 family)